MADETGTEWFDIGEKSMIAHVCGASGGIKRAFSNLKSTSKSKLCLSVTYSGKKNIVGRFVKQENYLGR